MMVPSPSERPASTYKSAVDHFIQSGMSSCLTLQKQEETSLPVVHKSNTQLLQQLMASANTLTTREDLLSTLRSDAGAMLSSVIASTVPYSHLCEWCFCFLVSCPNRDLSGITQHSYCFCMCDEQLKMKHWLPFILYVTSGGPNGNFPGVVFPMRIIFPPSWN